MENIEFNFGEYHISTDKNKMDIPAIHDFLSNHSGWSNGIPIEKVELSIQNSLNFGVFHHHLQIGFARIISDFATIAYLGDVYLLDEYRGKGISKADGFHHLSPQFTRIKEMDFINIHSRLAL